MSTDIEITARFIRECGEVRSNLKEKRHFQQVATEIGSILAWLHPHRKGFVSYLEIGAGAGLLAATVTRLLGIPNAYLIDNNKYDWAHDQRALNIPDAIQWEGDSTSKECAAAVAGWDALMDVVLIDGGHSREQVTSDTLLALSIASPGCWFIYHDFESRKGVQQCLRDVDAGKIPGLVRIVQFGNTILYRETRQT